MTSRHICNLAGKIDNYFLPTVFGGKNDEGDDSDVTSAGLEVVVEAGQRFDEDVAAFVTKLISEESRVIN